MKYTASVEYVKAQGRTVYQNETRYLGYSGSSITFRFHGNEVILTLTSNASDWDANHQALVAIFLDGATQENMRIQLTENEQKVTVYTGTDDQIHTISLVKLTEAEFAVCGIRSIEIEAGQLETAPPASDRKLQFIGDSITCGYGTENSHNEQEFRTQDENAWKAYAMQTATALHADAELVSWSGKGVYSNCIDEGLEEVTGPDQIDMLPEQYQYTDLSMARQIFHQEKKDWARWDHTQFEPDLICVNLGTNDAIYCQDNLSEKQQFQVAYLSFLQQIHQAHPASTILCMMGVMDNRLADQIQTAILDFKKQRPEMEDLIHYLQLPAQLEEDGLGTFWHPTVKTQTKVAQIVTAQIRSIMDWE